MSAIILRDEIVHYEVLGRGKPVIYLHDWIGSWRYWIPAMQATSHSFRTYALDLWGFGDTAKNPVYYSIEQQLNLLDDFLGVMGIGKIALIGHGLGAIVAILYALRQPDLVDRLMAIGYPYGESAINPRLSIASPEELADWLLIPTSETEAARAEAPKADPKALLLTLTSLYIIELDDLPYRLAIPYVLVHGQNDLAVEPPSEQYLAGLPVNAHYIAFETSGHFPMLERPSQFNRLLSDFLNLRSGDSPRQLRLKEEWKRRVR